MKVACSYLTSALSLRKIGAIHTRHLDFKATVSSTLLEQYSQSPWISIHSLLLTKWGWYEGGKAWTRDWYEKEGFCEHFKVQKVKMIKKFLKKISSWKDDPTQAFAEDRVHFPGPMAGRVTRGDNASSRCLMPSSGPMNKCNHVHNSPTTQIHINT